MTTKSRYVRAQITPDKVCAVTSANPGNAILKRWTNTVPAIPGVTPGNDGNNMTLAFGLVDAYNLPIPNTPAAPDYNGNVGGFQIPDTSGYQVSYADAWIVLPAGVNSVSFGARGFGNTSAGIYAGFSQKYAKRILWNNVFVGGAVDASKFPSLCGCRIVFVRTFCCNGYFHGGHYVQWNVGAGVVDIPVANTHGSPPFQSQYP